MSRIDRMALTPDRKRRGLQGASLRRSVFWNTTFVDSSPYDVQAHDHVLLVNTDAARTVNLPPARFSLERVLVVKDAEGTGAGTNNITIDANGSETIDGSATLVLSSNRARATLICDGTAWFIIG